MTWVVGRARASEAIDALDQIYALEQAYHFENKTFGNLTAIGYVPEGTNRYAYCVGNYQFASNCIYSATDTFAFIGARHMIIRASKPPAAPTVSYGSPFADVDAFEADAYGRVSNLPSPNDVDAWLIDQNQSLVHYDVGY